MSLREIILNEIRERGPILFSRYMELCLYHPELGYYSRAEERFGKAGDFYTSSDVHAVFGRLLARQFEEMWRGMGRPPRLDVIELGPGRGLFAADVMAWAEKKFPEFEQALRYTMVESSPWLRSRLEDRFAERIAERRVAVYERLEEVASAGLREVIVFANEFFDALPVEVVNSQGELRIAEQEGHFVETWSPARAEALEFLDLYSVHPEEGERVEAQLAAQEAMAHVMRWLLPQHARGYCVFVDYGYAREEQLAGRHRGTVKAIRQHAVSESPYEAPGEQDITADVNFTALAAAGGKAGAQLLGLVTQAQLLMGIGEDTQFADAFEETRTPQERAKVALQLKHLATPAGMGESFHALLLGRGVGGDLSGLKFAR